MNKYDVHLFTYAHEGARWTVEIPAVDERDARVRLGKLIYADYDGVLVAKLPSRYGAFAMLACAVRNAISQIVRPR